jgi:hypothetical protein
MDWLSQVLPTVVAFLDQHGLISVFALLAIFMHSSTRGRDRHELLHLDLRSL